MAELDSMIGLSSVKDQIRQITASVEAARRRVMAGYGAEKPMQHFVFLGPPGTGKTSVARVVAKIFYAFGLLDTPVVVEAQRADLVGEYLGATAIKTNQLVNSALGGVLFIDEAYSLVNDSEGQGDRFGHEAIQALLKRAEDDRTELIIILAGYEKQMEGFLASNPGLNSRFGLRVKFPTYSPAELMALAEASLGQRGEILDVDARPALWRMMEDVGRRRLADELGNGRFVRSLLEKAGRARDVRIMADGAEPSSAELVTLEASDLEQAGAELTARFRGYSRAPTLESALAELDELVGLEPVKRQVHEIAAQLRVARLRERQGLSSQPPVRHFVFTGPPGTGKTTVARILGRIFTALGLLVRPEVIEAHRADLVGEHLGSTAIKTGKLIDSALGGVLFIDEAYSLYNAGYSGGDAYGSEAVATLLKRAEDDRERLVIVLAGYPADMDRFLRSNPGLASRFSVRIGFPSYSADELCKIAGVIAEQHGDTFEPDALPVLGEIFGTAAARGQIDELGNGRFARSLFERACAARDLRVADLDEDASAADLTTVSAADLRGAFRELGGPQAGLSRAQPTPRSVGQARRQVTQRGDQAGLVAAAVPDDVHQRVQHRVPVLAPVQQPLRGLPQLGRVTTPQPVRQRQVPVDVQHAARPPVRVVMVGGQQRAPVRLRGRIQPAPGRCRRTCRAAPGTRTPGGAAPPGHRRAAAGTPATRPGRTRSGPGRPGRRCPSSRRPHPGSPRSSRRPAPGAARPSAPRRPARAASRAARPTAAAPCAAASRAGTCRPSPGSSAADARSHGRTRSR